MLTWNNQRLTRIRFHTSPNEQKMQTISSTLWLHLLALIMTMSWVSGCEKVIPSPNPQQGAIQLGGNYPRISSKDFAGTNSSQRTGKDEYNFTWSVATSTFLIEGDDIPEDLVTALLGDTTQTTRIEGKWEIKGETLHLSIDSGNDESPRAIALPIVNTGVIRVITPDAQYVFQKNRD